jgi:hypothetical protein
LKLSAWPGVDASANAQANANAPKVILFMTRSLVVTPRAEANGGLTAVKVRAAIPVRCMNDMTHHSRSLSGRMSVGVQKRSDRVSCGPNSGLAARVRAGVASRLNYTPDRR